MGFLRYTILHHTAIPDPHFDLLFETAPGSPLATWRSPEWPIRAATLVTRLPDHRVIYLDYEGPISNNRGEVRRIQTGTFEFEEQTSARWVLRLNGDQVLLLTLAAAPAWEARLVSLDSRGAPANP